ncbi:MAG: sugar phosphate isomerase/epimerase [Thaumarchaeota archaeon]|nr:sugar phosphate isomerase/epimerase [Nitrososphaerota archaeon]
MIPYSLGCGASFLYSDPDKVLDLSYPGRDVILRHIAWLTREGFLGVELGSNTFEHFVGIYDREFTATICAFLDDNSIKIVQMQADFLVPLITANSRGDAKERLDWVFGKVSELPCEIVSFSASLIPGFVSPHGYLFPGGPPSRIQLPNDFSWSNLWENYVEVVSLIVDRAVTHGIKVALEPRPREMVSTTDALLTLFRDVGSTSLGALVNTAYLFSQREYIPLSLQKLRDRVYATHLSDSDGLLEHRWAPGEGKIDWPETIKAFRSINYSGLLTLDVGVVGNPEYDFRQGKSFLERLMLTIS